VVSLLYFEVSFSNTPFFSGSLSSSLRHKAERTKMSVKSKSTFTFEHVTSKLECQKTTNHKKKKEKENRCACFTRVSCLAIIVTPTSETCSLTQLHSLCGYLCKYNMCKEALWQFSGSKWHSWPSP